MKHTALAHYRTDIDGLRALAVLPVIAFHLKLPVFRGGFVGVDVFFVISGFLIGSLIISELRDGTFSIVRFYKRRIGRILPAFIVMMIAILALGWRYDVPQDFRESAAGLIAAALSVSNIYFWRQANYFDSDAETKPALHTWSLGVEEQFYVVFPILLMLLYRYWPKRVPLAVVLICAASFAACVAMTRSYPESTFYLLPFRFWELGLGTILALKLIPAPTTTWGREILCLLGLALIGIPMVLYSSTTPFPGIAALFPCIGAALVILSNTTGLSMCGQLLSLPPVRLIGLISYSLYLWHWPLIVYQRSNAVFYSDSDHILSKLGLIVAALVISFASWKFVEQPVRRLAARRSSFGTIGAGLAATAVVAIFCVVVIQSNGAASRYPPEAMRLASYLPGSFAHFRPGVCFITGADSLEAFNRKLCLSTETNKPNYLLLGDSHAAHLWYGLSEVFPDIHFEQASVGSCPPTIDDPGLSKRFCREIMDEVFGSFMRNHPPSRLILAARWRPRNLPALADTLKALKTRGVSTVVIGPIVQYQYALPRLLADGARFHDPALYLRFKDREVDVLDDQIAALAAANGAEYISLPKLMCSPGRCATLSNKNEPLQFDTGHVTADGSVFVAQQIKDHGLLP